MRCVALDLGTATGYAFTDTHCCEPVLSGVLDLKPRRFEGAGIRFIRFRQGLIDLLPPRDEPAVIFVEEVHRHAGTTAAHVYGGLLAQLQVVAEERAIPFYGFGVGAIKKHATGRGNSGKDLMLSAAEERWPGAGIVEHDRADALWILSLGLETFSAESLRGGSERAGHLSA